jgi:hypothetical protein
MSKKYKSRLEALSEGQREEFLDRLVRVYKHLLSPASSEGMKLPWVKDVTEDVLRQRSEAEAQKESHPDE